MSFSESRLNILKSDGVSMLERVLDDVKDEKQVIALRKAKAKIVEEYAALFAEIQKQQHKIELRDQTIENYYKSYQG